MQTLMTAGLLRAAMPHSTEHNAVRFAPELATTLARYNITTPLRTAHFLAQVAQESGQLAFTEELASGAEYEGRHDLGNVEPGDGVRFKGRGLIQLTGRSNYQAYSNSCQQDFVSGNTPARIAEEAALAADVAGWFWQVHGLNALADGDDAVRITRRINGGLTGLPQRQRFLALAKAALAHSAAAANEPARQAAPIQGKLPGLSAASANAGLAAPYIQQNVGGCSTTPAFTRLAPVMASGTPADDNTYQDAA